MVSGDPVYVALERPEGKAVVLTANLDKGDLPFRTAFPILVTNAQNRFAGNRGELREALPTGAVTEVTLPSTDTEDEIVGSASDALKKKAADKGLEQVEALRKDSPPADYDR